MRDEQTTGARDRVGNRVDIPGRERAQVDQLALHAELGGGLVGGGRQHVQLRAPADQRHVVAAPHDVRLPERQLVVAVGHFLDRRSVQPLGLEKDHWIRIANRRQQQAFSSRRRRRHYDLRAKDIEHREQESNLSACTFAAHRIIARTHFQSRRVTKIGFGRLRMIETAVSDGAVRRANCEAANVELIARAIAILGRFVDDLRQEHTNERLRARQDK